MKSDKKERKTLQVANEKAPEPTVIDKIKFLFNEHHSMVYRAAYRVTGSEDDAEDVLQTVFLKLLQLEESGETPERPRAYLYKAAVNGSLDLLRRRKRWNSFPLDEGHLSVNGGGWSKEFERGETHELVRRALCNLSPLESKVFIMKYFEDCANKEISEILDTTSNNVNVALHSARKKLKKELSKSLERKS